jgi:hypothetical protein
MRNQGFILVYDIYMTYICCILQSQHPKILKDTYLQMDYLMKISQKKFLVRKCFILLQIYGN